MASITDKEKQGRKKASYDMYFFYSFIILVLYALKWTKLLLVYGKT